MPEMTYELFYGSGGHGGPYSSYEDAKIRAAAILRGSSTELTVYIKERTTGPGGYAERPCGYVAKDRDGFIYTQQGIGQKEYIQQ